ncbi:MAG: rod shape-determining protein RodA [Actinomycetota bacterium]
MARSSAFERPFGGRWVGRERAAFRHLDPTLIVATVALAVYGLFVVYSATHQSLEALGEDGFFFLKKQLAFVMLGLIAMALTASFDYRLVKVYAGIAYGVVVLLLLVVLTPLGSETAGAQRWITLFGFQFQPSEVAKLSVTAAMAAYLSEIRGGIRLEHVWRSAALAVGPMVLIFVQPDVGTMLVFAAILIGILVVGGARARHLGALVVVALVAIVVAFQLGIVKQYQIDRLTAFADPSSDPLRAGYNKAQAEIAIGAGGLTGKGYLHGTQTNLDFVPEQHTDFVFTVVGEELGFLGAMLLLGLYATIAWRGFRAAMLSKDAFGTLLASGLTVMIAFQIFVNVGMTVGIMPITGIPLPFVSYGGTSLLVNFVAVGLILNVHMRRFK